MKAKFSQPEIESQEDHSGNDQKGLINLTDVRCMIENLYIFSQIPMSIVNPEGKTIVSGGAREICTRFHWINPESSLNCLKCDQSLIKEAPKGSFTLYKCLNGLYEMAMPVYTGSQKIGTLFIGQFFIKEEALDYEAFRSNAAKYHFDENKYITALNEVPRLDINQIESAKILFLKLSDILSHLSYTNSQLTSSVKKTGKLLESICRGNRKLKRTEKLPEESNDRIEKSQEIAHLGSWEFDPVKKSLIWSDEVYRIFGLQPGIHIPTYESFLESVHPDDRAAVDQACFLFLTENSETFKIEHRIIRKNTGEVRYVLEKGEHFRNRSGKVVRSVGMVHDITEYKLSEKELNKSKEKLSLALEIANIGLWEWYFRSDDLFLDNRLENIFGLNEGSSRLTYNDFESLMNEHDIPHFKKNIARALNEDKPFETIFRTNGQNGQEKYISIKGNVEKDDSGDLYKMSGVCFDITEMKKNTENTFFRLNEELLRSNKALEEFAYIVSHDLQEPMRTVANFTSMLSLKYNNMLDETGREYIQYAVEGSERMYNMINGLLTYSRIQTRIKELKVIDFNSLLQEVLKMLAGQIRIRNALVTFDRLPVIAADYDQMIQLMQNLISNAIKFSEERPRVHVSFRPANNQNIFSVADNGLGIDNHFYEDIFKMFSRLQNDDEFKGTGIGLAICKTIVERHGGDIWVESVPGKGSTFYFTIPGNPESRI